MNNTAIKDKDLNKIFKDLDNLEVDLINKYCIR